MKISPLKYQTKQKNSILKSINKNQNDFKNISYAKNYTTTPISVLQANFIPFLGQKQKFEYKSISSLTPNYAPLNCDYNDIDEFSKAYSRKIDSQLKIITKDDIVNLINRIKAKTKADEDTIKQVLYYLSAYSTYQSLDKFQKIIEQNEIEAFGCEFKKTNHIIMDSSSNSVLNYLMLGKEYLNPSYKPGRTKFGIILDDTFLEFIKTCAKEDNKADRETFLDLRAHIISDDVVFLNIPSWDIKCSDGKYRSANFLLGSGYLEDLAIDVIKQIQQGESLDNILYGDFEERLNKIFNDRYKPSIVKVPIEHKNKVTIDDIYNNLKGYRITPKHIKETIEDYFTNIPKEHLAYCLKYFDENTYVFSPESYSEALMGLHTKIKNKIEKDGFNFNDAIYVIADMEKSFIYSAHTYFKLNDIPIKNSIGLEMPDKIKNASIPAVVLDDISGSGITQRANCYTVSHFLDYKNPIYYGCLLTCPSAISLNTAENTTVNQFQFQDFDLMSPFNKKKIGIYSAIKDRGFHDICSCALFPYMAPDTNIDFFSRLFLPLLYRNGKN